MKTKNRVLSEVFWIAKLLFATALIGLSFNLFLDPANISFGGVTGVGMIVRKLIGKETLFGIGTVPVVSLLLNIPLFLFGFKTIGKRFFFGSLFCAVFTSVFIQAFSPLKGTFGIVSDKLLFAVFGGAATGLSIGLAFISEASTGGTDIAARLLKTKFRNLPIGALSLSVDIVIVSVNGIVHHDLTSILYSAVTIYVAATMMDVVVYKFDYSKVALIITDKYEEVAAQIDRELRRGVTFLQAKGYYQRTDKYVLLCAVKRSQLAELQQLVNNVDENAFIIIQEAHQVLGDGFKHYSRNAL